MRQRREAVCASCVHDSGRLVRLCVHVRVPARPIRRTRTETSGRHMAVRGRVGQGLPQGSSGVLIQSVRSNVSRVRACKRAWSVRPSDLVLHTRTAQSPPIFLAASAYLASRL